MKENFLHWITDPVITGVQLLTEGRVAVLFGDRLTFHFSDADEARVVVGSMQLDPGEYFHWNDTQQSVAGGKGWCNGSDARVAVRKWIEAGHRDQK